MKCSTKLWNLNLGVLAIAATVVLTGCGSSNSSSSAADDNSASGAAAGAAGGALSGSSSGGTLAMFDMPKSTSLFASVKSSLNPFSDAFADVACPTYKTVGSGCAASGGDMWLSYSDCSFAGINTWNGVQQITSTASASCGSFPYPGDNGSITRQYVASSGASVPSTMTITTPAGIVGTVDDASANLANFDGDSISVIANGGYGAQVSFNSIGARSGLDIAHRVYTSSFDHSITGSLTVVEAGAFSTSRTLSGSLKVYHNLLKIVGNATFNSVVHQDGCCVPVSGSISTLFSRGNSVAPTAAGLAYIGKTETLAFTGCKTATFTAVDGSVSNVTLNRCF
jgi:hypothetical protein